MHWEPNSSIFEEQEHACTNIIGDLLPRPTGPEGKTLIINQVTLSTNVDAAELTADDNFASFLQANEHVTVSQLSRLPTKNATVSEISNYTNSYGTIQSNKRKKIDGYTLARRWSISSEKSIASVKNTTQRGFRSVMHPTLSRRYPTNNRMLRYKRMPHPVFSDTLQAGKKSAHVNIYGKAFCTIFGWYRCHPMKKESEAHNTFYMMFKRDGVPTHMIVDKSKEKSLGEFRRKCREADCHLINSEPYLP